MSLADISVLRTQLGGILRRPGRLLMTGLSVLVASFVVFGTVLTYQTVTRTTLDTFSDTPRGVSLVVHTDDDTPIPAARMAAIRRTPGVVQAVGRNTAVLGVGDASSGTSIDLIADPGTGPLSRVTLVAGGYPDGDREVALDRRFAERLGAAPGSTLRLRGGAEGETPVKVAVSGVVDGPQDGNERAYAPDVVVAALGGLPDYQRIDVLVAPAADVDAVQEEISAMLSSDPDSYAAVTTGEGIRIKEAQEAVEQYDQIFALVAMFVAIAVVAAALVATSTFRIVFAQRLRQLALLRTIGAQSGQLVRALAVEGAAVGLFAGAVGVLLALATGLAAPALAAATGRTISSPGVPVGAGVAVVIGAVLLTVAAVLAPAFSAADVAPLQALRSAGTVAAERGISVGRLLVGLLLAAGSLGVGCLAVVALPEPGQQSYSSSTGLLYIVGVGGLAFGALIALGPVLIRPVLAVAGWPLRRLGPTGGLAVSGIGGTPRRAAAVSVVVALGVALLAGTVVGLSSLQAWTDQSLAARNPADLVMFAEEQPITDDVLTRLRADARFGHVTPFRTADFVVGSVSFVAIDIDMTALPELAKLTASSGSIADLGPGRALLAHGLAESLGVRAGDDVTLRAEQGREARVTVAAILTDDAPLQMDAVLAPADLNSLGAASTAPSGVLADIAGGGAARSQALAAFRQIGGGIGGEVGVLADARDKENAEVSSLFAAALGLLGLTVLIAVVGVGTTTGLSVLQRTQESGLLRALGLSRSRLRAMIGMESGLYGLIGSVLGLVLGVPLAWLALKALNLGLPLMFPVGRLLLILLTLTAITVVAGLLPARQAAKVSPVAALQAAE
ncbi:FtsX-like permease family protein [Micromonospora rubida]